MSCMYSEMGQRCCNVGIVQNVVSPVNYSVKVHVMNVQWCELKVLYAGEVSELRLWSQLYSECTCHVCTCTMMWVKGCFMLVLFKMLFLQSIIV